MEHKDIQTPAERYKNALQQNKQRIQVGIDTGVHTGFAIWDRKHLEFKTIETLKIHKAMETLETAIKVFGIENVNVRFEDARLRKWFGNAGREQLQGAGSIKRDCTIWEDYLTDLKISFEAVPPKSNTTKLKADVFKKLTKFLKVTSEHGRDAAMLVYQF